MKAGFRARAMCVRSCSSVGTGQVGNPAPRGSWSKSGAGPPPHCPQQQHLPAAAREGSLSQDPAEPEATGPQGETGWKGGQLTALGGASHAPSRRLRSPPRLPPKLRSTSTAACPLPQSRSQCASARVGLVLTTTVTRTTPPMCQRGAKRLHASSKVTEPHGLRRILRGR